VLEEALEHLVTGIVDHKDQVQVRQKELRRGEILEVRVHPDDLGRVIDEIIDDTHVLRANTAICLVTHLDHRTGPLVEAAAASKDS